jgi:dTDP-4-amino-4,6-dideoxygalactose transaminase
MDEILAIASRHGLPVVEDNAHGLFGKYKGRWLGTFGAMATQSFHETKNFTCGEGGALLLNDEQFVERAEILREKGTNRSRFFRGQVDKYSWVDVGSSYVMSDILAAFLYAQFESREQIQQKRRVIWETYHDGLADWAKEHGYRLPIVPEHCEQAYHMFYLLLTSLEERQAFIEHLKANRILAVFHYLPLDRSEMALSHGFDKHACPVTSDVSDRLVRLPFYNGLTGAEQQEIIEVIRAFRPAAARP